MDRVHGATKNQIWLTSEHAQSVYISCEESKTDGLKLSIQKTKIVASGPITSWQIDRENVEVVTGFIFLGSKITSDGDYNHEIKRHLFLGKKAMTNLDSILKSRDITLLTKVHIAKTMVLPIVMYRCEISTIKKVEGRRTGGFNCGIGEDSWESLGLQRRQANQS